MLPAMKLLAQGRRLRGTAARHLRLHRGAHGWSARWSRAYRQRIEALLPSLTPERLKVATDIAALPLSMRGFGHVKLANVALARAREAELLHRFDPAGLSAPGAGAGRGADPRASG